MILKAIPIPLVMVVLATLFISISNGNEYLLPDSFNNYVKIGTDSKYRNDCDEQDRGTNGAICADEDTTTSIDGIYIEGQNNKVTSNIHVNQIQKCDESNMGNSNAFCSNTNENFLDTISVSGNNNINYDINAKQTNDCDDKLSGNNDVQCENELETQINSVSLSGNNNPIDLDVNTRQSNDCDDKTNNDYNLKCTNLQQQIETP